MQTSFSQFMPSALEGLHLAAYSHEIISKSCQADVRFGTIVVRPAGAPASFSDLCKQPAAPAADVDSWILTGVSTAGTQTYVPGGGAGLDFDGAGIGGTDGLFDDAELPGWFVQIVFDAHGDWDATTGVLKGVSCELGHTDAENVNIATSATWRSTKAWKRITSLYLPAQTGGGGTFTAGVSINALPVLDGSTCWGIAIRDSSVPQESTPAGYEQYMTASIIRRGFVWVLAEATVRDGDPVYARLITAGAEVAGAMRATPDGTADATGLHTGTSAPDCARVKNAYFRSSVTGAGLALVELDLDSQ